MSAPSATSDRWLWGPVADLLFGCGLLYALIFVVLLFAGTEVRTAQPGFLFPLLILLVSTPHYGATLVRVYEESAERQRYAFFAIWVSLLIWAVVFAALFSPFLGSVLATVLFTWSPWHYTGQNYGIAMLLLRRRGVEVAPGAKRLIYASYVLSFAMVFLNLNGGVAPAATPRGYTATDVRFLSLEIPTNLVDSLLAFAVVGFAAAFVGAGIALTRRARVRDIAPAALLSLAQVLWFIGPLLVQRWQLAPGVESLNLEQRTYYFVWAGLAHGAQYLWITSYYRRRSTQWSGLLPYWLRTLMAGALVWTLPVLLFSPTSLGRLASGSSAFSYDTGLALIVAAGVNLHHFMLDGVIWKLRNLRIASVLIRNEPDEADLGATTAESWGRRIGWSLAGLALAVALVVFWQQSVEYPRLWSRGDYAGAGRVLDRLSWLGYDSHSERSMLGDATRSAGNLDESIRHYEVALILRPGTGDVHYRLANALRARGDAEEAIVHYREALLIEPQHADAHYNLGNALASERLFGEAIDHYRAAIDARPTFAQAHNNLGNALQAKGDLDGAITHYREAVRLKPGYTNANDNLGRALRQKW